MNEKGQVVDLKFIPIVCERCGQRLAQVAVPKSSDQTSVKVNPGNHICTTGD